LNEGEKLLDLLQAPKIKTCSFSGGIIKLSKKPMPEPQPSRFPTWSVTYEQENLKPHVLIGENTLHMQKYMQWDYGNTNIHEWLEASERENFRPVNIHGGFQFKCRGQISFNFPLDETKASIAVSKTSAHFHPLLDEALAI
jgi:hypothetical protein